MKVTRKAYEAKTVLAGEVPAGKTFKYKSAHGENYCDFLAMEKNSSIEVISQRAGAFVLVYNINSASFGVVDVNQPVYRTKASLVIRG